jgi:hypothetical protein
LPHTLSLICLRIPVKRSPPNTKGIADIGHREGFIGGHVPEHLYLLGGECLRPSACSSSAPCSCKSCPCPLADNLPLELRQGAKDVKNQLSPAGRGIDVLLQALEADPLLIEGGNGVDKVSEGAAKAIQPPDYERIPTS